MEAQIVLMDLLEGKRKALADFLAATPLSCTDKHKTVLAAILPSHPHWNAMPEPGGEVGYVLKVAQAFSEMWFHLPASHDYRALRITAVEPVLHFEIDTAAGTVRTNLQELSSKMAEWEARSAQERLAAFDALSDEYRLPVARKKLRAFTSKTLGKIKPDEFGDIYEADPLAVSYFDGKQVETQLFNVTASDRAAIDAAMTNFLGLGEREKSVAAPLVLANCHEFLEAVGAETDEDRRMQAIADPSEIWRFVDCEALRITRNDSKGEPSIYISLICKCAWEQEHGLQIVYRNGETLERVSAQDGHPVL